MQRRNTYRRVGINEPDVWVWNPLPETTLDELREAVGLANRFDPSSDPYFGITWTYSHGPEREHVVLAPGESRLLKESIARAMLRETQEMGVVSLSPDADEAEWEQAKRNGLRAAYTYWRDRGRPRIQAFALKNSFSDDQLEQHKSETAQWWINEAAAEVIAKAQDAPTKKRRASTGKTVNAPDAA